jgi:8-oxo-dGTP diphosphatase
MNLKRLSENLIKMALDDNIHRFVVGALVKRRDSFLVLQRKKDDFMGGIDELPSGKVESGESLLEALDREVVEETKLSVRRVLDYIGHFDYISGSGRKTRQFNFVVEVVGNSVEINLAEHDGFKWVSLSNINKTLLTKSVTSLVVGYYKSVK